MVAHKISPRICLLTFVFELCSSQMEMLFCSTIVGAPFLLLPMILTGELFTAWNSCYQVKMLCIILGNAFSHDHLKGDKKNNKNVGPNVL